MATIAQPMATQPMTGAPVRRVETVLMNLRCSWCGSHHTEPVDVDVCLMPAIASITCMWCGRCNVMRKPTLLRKVGAT